MNGSFPDMLDLSDLSDLTPPTCPIHLSQEGSKCPTFAPAPRQPGGQPTPSRCPMQRYAHVRHPAELSREVLDGGKGGGAHEDLASPCGVRDH